MKCPKCGFLTFDNLDSCKRCGADWTPERAKLSGLFQARGKKEPDSTPPEETSLESSHPESTSAAEPSPTPVLPTVRPQGVLGVKLRIDEEFDRFYTNLKVEEQKVGEVRWGGFFRRCFAFAIDVVVLSLFSLFLLYVVYVGYSVGLTAHHQTITFDRFISFLQLFILSWFLLVSGYFVLLHGMAGTTVGKWVFGLRVVGANKAPVSYRQAMVRWFGYVAFAFFGIGFVWILLSREKRAWHDLLARTWVVRDLAGTARS